MTKPTTHAVHQVLKSDICDRVRRGEDWQLILNDVWNTDFYAPLWATISEDEAEADIMLLIHEAEEAV